MVATHGARGTRRPRALAIVVTVAAAPIGAGALADAGAAVVSGAALSTRFTALDLSSAPGPVFSSPSFARGAAAPDDEAPPSSTAGISFKVAPPGSAKSDGAAHGSSDASGAAAPAPATDSAAVRFGARGSLQFNIFGDYQNDFEDASMAGLQLGMSWFFVDDLSLDLQLEQYGVFQDGGDAYAVGPALGFRWHFLARETWSLYADLGCGFIVSTRSVPIDGSEFNFTPRAGVGASFEIAPRARVMTGVRWFHISNANTSTPNPGRNNLELYAGISLPF